MESAAKIRGVAFDLDGTLFNTEVVYDMVGEQLMARRGHVLRPAVVAQMMGRPSHIALQVLREAYQLTDSIPELQQEAGELFVKLLAGRATLMPGAMDMLDLVESMDLPKCITTSSEPELVTPLLRLANIEERFRFVLTSVDVTKHKPEPEIYCTAADRLGIPVGELLVFEDSQVGCAAAVAAGAITIAVPSKHKGVQDFRGATLMADSLSEPAIRQLIDSRILIAR